MTVRDLIKLLAEYPMELNVNFDAKRLYNFRGSLGCNAGCPSIDGAKIQNDAGGDYLELYSNEINQCDLFVTRFLP